MEAVKEEAVAFAMAHGLAMMDKGHGYLASHAPMSLLPTKVSKDAFLHAKGLAVPFGILVDKVARDLDWIYETLDGVLENDQFTKRLVELCKKVENDGVVQRSYLGIHRSDYMLDHGKTLLQVELNTIASSFGCLSTRVSEMHKFLIERYGSQENFVKEFLQVENVTEEMVKSALPENIALKAIPKGLAGAVHHYVEQQNLPEAASRPAVLFVVQDGESNSFDQRMLEFELWNSYKIPTIRRSLADVAKRGSLNGPNKQLCIDGYHISVTYFRAGYTPADYPTEVEWDGRLLIESSVSIKCPSIQYHLVGTKKVQQRLAAPGQVERFVPGEQGALLRSCFAGLWSMDVKEQDDAAKKAIEQAKSDPDNYVVKPQREGGGNNLYGLRVKEALETMSSEEQASYILMQRIHPVEVDSCLVRKGHVIHGKALQEVGIYNTCLFNSEGASIFNEEAGHLLRTKASGVDEGGVATGFSCLDSPFLV